MWDFMQCKYRHRVLPRTWIPFMSVMPPFVYLVCHTAWLDSECTFRVFQSALLEEYRKEKTGKVRGGTTNLSYPIAKISGFDIHLERNFYGVRLRSDQSSENHRNRSSSGKGKTGSAAVSEEAILRAITNIEYVQVIVIWSFSAISK